MSDPFRVERRNLSEVELDQIADVKADARRLWERLEEAEAVAGAAEREFDLARQRLEEAVMWAVKGITG